MCGDFTYRSVGCSKVPMLNLGIREFINFDNSEALVYYIGSQCKKKKNTYIAAVANLPCYYLGIQ